MLVFYVSYCAIVVLHARLGGKLVAQSTSELFVKNEKKDHVFREILLYEKDCSIFGAGLLFHWVQSLLFYVRAGWCRR